MSCTISRHSKECCDMRYDIERPVISDLFYVVNMLDKGEQLDCTKHAARFRTSSSNFLKVDWCVFETNKVTSNLIVKAEVA